MWLQIISDKPCIGVNVDSEDQPEITVTSEKPGMIIESDRPSITVSEENPYIDIEVEG